MLKILIKLNISKQFKPHLKQIKELNSLESDIYTVVIPEWAQGKMIFVTMSNDKTYIGNGLKMNEHVKATFKDGDVRSSKLYKDEEGNWISGFAPIKNKDGKVIAVIEVDYNAERKS